MNGSEPTAPGPGAVDDALREGVIGARMARGAAVMLGSRLAVAALQFVSFAVIASHLGPTHLGTYSLAIAFVGVFTVVPSFGFQPVVVRDIAQRPEIERSLLPNLAYLRLLLGGVAYGLLVATLVLGGYEGPNRRAALVANTLLFVLAANSLALALHVRVRHGLLSAFDAAKDILFVVGAVGLARADAGVISFLWLYVAVNVVNALAGGAAALRSTRFDWRPRPTLMASLLRSAAPLALSALFSALYFRIDMAILARLKPGADVGIYGAAYRFLDMFLVLPVIVMALAAPVLARSAQLGREVLEGRYRRMLHLLALVAVFVAVTGTMTAARVLPAIPGFGAYARAGPALAILSVAAALLLLGSMVQGTLVATHNAGRLLRISGAGMVITILVNIALIPRFSFIGAAVATVVTEVVSVIWSVVAVRRLLGLRWAADRLPQVAAAAAVLAGALAIGYLLPPFAQLALGAFAYGVALLPTGALRWCDLRGLAPGDGSLAVVGIGVGADKVAAVAARSLAELGPVRLDLPGPRLRDVWRSSRPSGSCQLVVGPGIQARWAPLAARLAGCDPVRIVLVDDGRATAAPGGGWVQRRVWPLLADEVVTAAPRAEAP